MRYRLITAFAAFQFDHSQPAPAEICYLPEGDSKITPFVDGKAQAITVKVPAAAGIAIAANPQAALAERQKAKVRPWFDFEYKSGASSALPKKNPIRAGKLKKREIQRYFEQCDEGGDTHTSRSGLLP